MSFGGNFRTDKIPCLNTFEQARKHYMSVAPTRGWDKAPGAPRFLAERTNKDKIIHMTHDRVMCKLYRTDVVTYHSDGAITVQPYSSSTTNQFVQKLLGRHNHLTIDMTAAGGAIAWVHHNIHGMRGYKFGGYALRFRPDGDDGFVVDEAFSTPAVFERYMLDTAKLNAVYKETGYKDFQAWHQAAFKAGSLADLPQRNSWMSRIWTPNDGEKHYDQLGSHSIMSICYQVIDLLRERRFRDIAALLGVAPTNTDEVRMCLICATPDAIRLTKLPFVTDRQQPKAIRESSRRWAYWHRS